MEAKNATVNTGQYEKTLFVRGSIGLALGRNLNSDPAPRYPSSISIQATRISFFLSGQFSDTQISWSTLEKEGLSVIATIELLHWLAPTTDGLGLFTYHNDLVFIFDRVSLSTDLSQTAIRKILRWVDRPS